MPFEIVWGVVDEEGAGCREVEDGGIAEDGGGVRGGKGNGEVRGCPWEC